MSHRFRSRFVAFACITVLSCILCGVGYTAEPVNETAAREYLLA